MPVPDAYRLTVPAFRPKIDTDADHYNNLSAIDRAVNRLPIFDTQVLRVAAGNANTNSTTNVDMTQGAGGAPTLSFTVYDNKTRVMMGMMVTMYCSAGGGLCATALRFQKANVDTSFQLGYYYHNAFGAGARHDLVGGFTMSTPGQLPPGTYTVTARWNVAVGTTTINTDGNDLISFYVAEVPTFP